MVPAGEESTMDDEASAAGSRGWLVASTVVGAALVTWFFFAWLALDRNAVDAAGESVGTAFALLVVAAVVGAVRQSGD